MKKNIFILITLSTHFLFQVNATAAGFYFSHAAVPEACKEIARKKGAVNKKDFNNLMASVAKGYYSSAKKPDFVFKSNATGESCHALNSERPFTGDTRVEFYRGFYGKIFAQINLWGHRYSPSNIGLPGHCDVEIEFEVSNACNFSNPKVLKFKSYGPSRYPVF